MYEVIIAEKPSVAQKIARALSQNVRQKKFGKVRYFEVKVDEKCVLILPAAGHLFGLTSREKGFPTFSYGWVPAWKISKRAAFTKDYVGLMKKFVSGAEKIISGCDYDIEGSTIAFNIIRAFGDVSKARRMHFSVLTPSELRSAYENLEPYDYAQSIAGETRHIIDWLWGINLSRAAIAALRTAGARRTLSIGRVQGPMLRFIIEREMEIAQFVPRPFWELCIWAKGTKFVHTKGRFFALDEVSSAQLRTPREGVIEITHTRKKIPPPPPFDFTTLQIEAQRKLALSPIETQRIAQRLYESSLISYPRTSSQKLPSKLNLSGIIKKLSRIKEFSKRAQNIIAEGKFKPREGKLTDPAHPSIHPTGVSKRLRGDELKLYNLIVSRFLACFAPPAEIEERCTTLIAGDEKYIARTKHIIEHGWLRFYKWHGIKEDPTPPFVDGEKVKIEKFEILKRKTSPPPRFTPADIIAVLERYGIGTKQTRAQVLDTLYKRSYIRGKQIVPTPLGLGIYDTFAQHAPAIVDPKLTAKLDDELNAIAEGRLEQEKVIDDAKAQLLATLSRLKEKEKEIGFQLLAALRKTEMFAPCRCGGNLRIIEKGKSKFLGCTNYPKCKITYPLPKRTFSFVRLCECGAPIIKVWKKEVCIDKKCNAVAHAT